MNEKIKELLKKAMSDEGVKAKLSACKNEEEVVNFAKELGLTITKEDIMECNEQTNNKEAEMISGGVGGILPSCLMIIGLPA